MRVLTVLILNRNFDLAIQLCWAEVGAVIVAAGGALLGTQRLRRREGAIEMPPSIDHQRQHQNKKQESHVRSFSWCFSTPSRKSQMGRGRRIKREANWERQRSGPAAQRRAAVRAGELTGSAMGCGRLGRRLQSEAIRARIQAGRAASRGRSDAAGPLALFPLRESFVLGS